MPRAAVLTGLGAPLELWDDVAVEEPRPGEVAVRVAASGVCHSDLAFHAGNLPITLPAVLGHEGAGVIERVGAGVDELAAGDHVVVSWVPQCGQCYFCLHAQPELCTEADTVLITGGLLDGTPRLRARGTPVHQVCGCGTFAETTVVAAIGAVKVPDDLDLATAALLGCSVLTGVGAALNTARIVPGDTVAVVGCGGVGLNVIQGARIAGAGEIVAVDVNEPKLELARRMGATATVDASRADPVAVLRDMTAERGADVAFEAIGTGPTIVQTVEMTRRGGEAVLVGLPPLDVTLSLPAFMAVILQERTIKGCWYGSADVRRDVPRLVELYRQGTLLLDELVARRIALDEVNSAFETMRAGDPGRSVIVY